MQLPDETIAGFPESATQLLDLGTILAAADVLCWAHTLVFLNQTPASLKKLRGINNRFVEFIHANLRTGCRCRNVCSDPS